MFPILNWNLFTKSHLKSCLLFINPIRKKHQQASIYPFRSLFQPFQFPPSSHPPNANKTPKDPYRLHTFIQSDPIYIHMDFR